MSPAFVPGKKPVVSKVKPQPEEASLTPAARRWVMGGLVVVCAWLIVTGLSRLLSNKPPVSSGKPSSAEAIPASPPEQLPEAPSSAPPTARTMMHYEAVHATMESLRKHARENPDAPDALSEERIKALEKQGALIL
jgi:hypothetical protein